MDVFIKSAEAISPQDTFDSKTFLTGFKKPELDYFSCIVPDYKKYIDAKVLRRMSKIVRMGIASSKKALQTANIDLPDAIIVGTGLGCLEDTEKFLYQMIENKETLLNPTAFIQSTHNTVAGQIALVLGCKNYNLTFSQQSISFESALLDAYLMLQENKAQNILVGGIDEMTENTNLLLKKAASLQDSIGKSCTAGNKPGEGACFFILSNTSSDKNLAKISAISVLNRQEDENELPAGIRDILEERKIKVSEIDVVISGINGDLREDKNYNSMLQIFKESTHVAYKHLVGEYDTASGFALWLGAKIIQEQFIPGFININQTNRQNIKNILIHHYNNKHGHSFILVNKC